MVDTGKKIKHLNEHCPTSEDNNGFGLQKKTSLHLELKHLIHYSDQGFKFWSDQYVLTCIYWSNQRLIPSHMVFNDNERCKLVYHSIYQGCTSPSDCQNGLRIKFIISDQLCLSYSANRSFGLGHDKLKQIRLDSLNFIYMMKESTTINDKHGVYT